MKQNLAPHAQLPEYYTPNEQQRRAFITDLFDTTAGEYDRIIQMMSFNSGNWYRKQALQRAALCEGMHVLDVATGTAPVAEAEKQIVGASGSVIGLDRSIGMLQEAQQKLSIPFIQASAEQLPFPDAQFDFLSMGYALRHVDDLDVMFREYWRVLKPGGKILLLELTKPRSKLGLAFSRLYLGKAVPFFARLGANKGKADDSAKLMKYFWDTIEHCVSPEIILDAMREAGFNDVKRHRVMGLFSEYVGIKS